MLIPRTNVRNGSVIPIKPALKLAAKTGIESFRYLGYSVALGTFLLFTVPGNKTLNDIARVIKLAPHPNSSKLNEVEINGYKYDAFYCRNDKDLKIPEIIKELNIDPSQLDKNQNGLIPILSTREGVCKLTEILKLEITNSSNESKRNKIAEALAVLNKIDLKDKLIFGKDGVNSEKFYQGQIGNCQIMAAIKGLSFTPENIQELRGMIEVTGYNFDKNNFYIDTAVHLDGTVISVPFTDLVSWMSPRDFDLSHSTDGSLLLSILAIAVEKAADKYDKVPHLVEATSPTLITGKDYNTIAVWSLDDDNLRDVLSLAPDRLITVGSYMRAEDITIEYFIHEIEEKFKSKTAPIVSTEKAEEFKARVRRRMNEFLEKNEPHTKNDIKQKKIFPSNQIELIAKSSIFASSTQEEEISNINGRPVIPNHEYAVYKYDKEKDLTYLTDSHGVEYNPLSLKELREKIGSIVIERELASNINSRTVTVSLLVIIAALVTRKLARKGNKWLNPEYRSYPEIGFDWLKKKVSKSSKPEIKGQLPQ